MEFLSCDWGTSNFRLRWTGRGMHRVYHSEEGAGKIAAEGGDRAARFKSVLAAAMASVGAPPGLPVVISGMASASIGWKELPYAGLPFPLDGTRVSWHEVEPGVFLIGGVCSDEEVMRGEETQAVGWAFTGVGKANESTLLVLPGTHSKHLWVEAGRVTHFRTYMTGELFDLLAKHSVLRHSVRLGAAPDEGAFREGVAKGADAPLNAALFRVRTRQVLDRVDAGVNTSFLSGLLIGAEMAEAGRAKIPVVVACGVEMGKAYICAAEKLSFAARVSWTESENLCEQGQRRILELLLNGKAAGDVGAGPRGENARV